MFQVPPAGSPVAYAGRGHRSAGHLLVSGRARYAAPVRTTRRPTNPLLGRTPHLLLLDGTPPGPQTTLAGEALTRLSATRLGPHERLQTVRRAPIQDNLKKKIPFTLHHHPKLVTSGPVKIFLGTSTADPPAPTRIPALVSLVHLLLMLLGPCTGSPPAVMVPLSSTLLSPSSTSPRSGPFRRLWRLKRDLLTPPGTFSFPRLN